MATTTPNFGWPVPTSTDLVKDGATAIEALGDSIDASLLDLKGGTTGQVLSKTTNTDMDFVWVTTDDANAIQNSIVDAKGDLIAATANDTPARLAVGANNTLLTADSTAATGIKWGGAWTTWTPTLTGITLGNGTQYARYAQIGKTVFVEYQLTFGSTTTITSPAYISVPVNMALYGNISFLGEYLDSGVAGYAALIGCPNGALFELACYAANQTYLVGAGISSTVPFTWTTNDRVSFRATYEAA
jgi:hypothetical protein